MLVRFLTKAVTSQRAKVRPTLASALKYEGRWKSVETGTKLPWLGPVHWPLPRTKAEAAGSGSKRYSKPSRALYFGTPWIWSPLCTKSTPVLGSRPSAGTSSANTAWVQLPPAVSVSASVARQRASISMPSIVARPALVSKSKPEVGSTTSCWMFFQSVWKAATLRLRRLSSRPDLLPIS